MSFENFLAEFQKSKELGEPFISVTIVLSQGSAPQDLGSRMLVGSAGRLFGTVGGGMLEKTAIEAAQKILAASPQSAQLIQWNLQKDLGMSCGGVVGMLFETHYPTPLWKIAIFGAGHVAQELIRVLLRLECDITCIDSRLEWLNKLPESARLQRLHSDPMALALPKIHPDSFVACMTMGHRTDQPIVDEALRNHSFPYLGVIGSETKATSLRSKLREAGISEDKISSVICPIGEKIGSNSPSEIAISISAQLLRFREMARQQGKA